MGSLAYDRWDHKGTRWADFVYSLNRSPVALGVSPWVWARWLIWVGHVWGGYAKFGHRALGHVLLLCAVASVRVVFWSLVVHGLSFGCSPV